MDVKQMNHRGRKRKFQRDVITNLNEHFVSSNKCLRNQMLGSPVSKFWRKRVGVSSNGYEARIKQYKWMLRPDLFLWIGNCIRRGRDFKTRLIVPAFNESALRQWATHSAPSGCALAEWRYPLKPSALPVREYSSLSVSLLPLLAQKDELISG